jgi:hypothetical protein
MRRTLISLAATAGLAAAALAGAPAASATSHYSETAEGLFETWAVTLADTECGNGEAMGNLYRRGAILLATFDPIVRGRDDITEYFDGLSCLEDLDVELNTWRAGGQGNLVWATGLYTFSSVEDGELVEVPARYTYVWKANRKGTYRIVNHHSSVTP